MKDWLLHPLTSIPQVVAEAAIEWFMFACLLGMISYILCGVVQEARKVIGRKK